MPPETGAGPGATEPNPTNTPAQSAESGSGEQPQQSPGRLAAVLSMMEDVPAEVRERAAQPKEGTHEHQKSQESSQPGEAAAGAEHAASAAVGTGAPGRNGAPAGRTPGEAQPQGRQQKETLGRADEQDDESEPDGRVQDDWPDSAKERVGRLTAKKNQWKATATTELEKRQQTEQERDRYKEQLQRMQPVRVTPTPQDPLADIENEQELARAVQDYEELLEWATLNPDGVQGAVIGKDKDGNQITRDYTAEQMAKIRLDTERVLRKNVPLKAGYLRERTVNDQVARELYPEMFDSNSEDYQLSRQLMQQMPELMRFTDAYLNVGRYLRGLRAEIAENEARRSGKTVVNQHARGPVKPVSREAEPFTRPQPPIAPATPQVRGGSAAPVAQDGQIKAAREQAAETGSDESLETLIGAIRDARRSGQGKRAAALV